MRLRAAAASALLLLLLLLCLLLLKEGLEPYGFRRAGGPVAEVELSYLREHKVLGKVGGRRKGVRIVVGQASAGRRFGRS